MRLGADGGAVLDITKLRGPHRGVFFDLYVITDIYSRYISGWMVASTESGDLAEAFMAIHGQPNALHAVQLKAPHPWQNGRACSRTRNPVALSSPKSLLRQACSCGFMESECVDSTQALAY